MHDLFRFGVAACALLFLLAPCAAQQSQDSNSEAMTGNRGGARTRLSQKGVSLEAVYTADHLATISGSASRGSAYMGNLDIKALADMDRLAGWSGSRIFMHLIGNHGGKINERVGSFMGIDNIEVEANGGKIFQAWFEQRFLGNSLSLLGGLYAVDSEFNVNESSDLFLHPAFGTGPEFAQSGRNGPSIFPTTSAGIRVKFQFDPAAYVQAALLDGGPGDPHKPRGTHIRFGGGDGALLVAEAGFSPSRAEQVQSARRRRAVLHPGLNRPQIRARPISKVAAGFWRYTGRFDDLSDTDGAGRPLPRRSFGAYVLAEETLFQERNNHEQGLSAFISYGVANADANVIDYSLVTGLRYLGLFPGRAEDELGLGFVRAHAGGKFRMAQATAGISAAKEENAIELTYRAQITPWLAAQPTVQRIANSGFNAAANPVWVVGLRVEINF